MKIVKIETYLVGNPWKNWLFTQVYTDKSIYGVGEGSLNYFAKTVQAAIHELEHLVLGMDPFEVELICQRLIRDVYSEGGQIHMSAVAAIEIACWDIIGKVCNQPLYNLWEVAATTPFERMRMGGTGVHVRRTALRTKLPLWSSGVTVPLSLIHLVIIGERFQRQSSIFPCKSSPPCVKQ